MPRQKVPSKKTRISPPSRQSMRSATLPRDQAVNPQRIEEEIPRSRSGTPTFKRNMAHQSLRERAQRRLFPGSLALQQIKLIQKSQGMMCRKANFQRFARYITKAIMMEEQDPDDHEIRFSQPALELLQSLTEEYMTTLFEDSLMCTLHARRVTLQGKDMILARKIRGRIETAFSYIPKRDRN